MASPHSRQGKVEKTSSCGYTFCLPVLLIVPTKRKVRIHHTLPDLLITLLTAKSSKMAHIFPMPHAIDLEENVRISSA